MVQASCDWLSNSKSSVLPARGAETMMTGFSKRRRDRKSDIDLPIDFIGSCQPFGDRIVAVTAWILTTSMGNLAISPIGSAIMRVFLALVNKPGNRARR